MLSQFMFIQFALIQFMLSQFMHAHSMHIPFYAHSLLSKFMHFKNSPLQFNVFIFIVGASAMRSLTKCSALMNGCYLVLN